MMEVGQLTWSRKMMSWPNLAILPRVPAPEKEALNLLIIATV
jgi:hypothetical protein